MATTTSLLYRAMPAVGPAVHLRALLDHPQVREPIQRAHASTLLRGMLDRLLTGQLTSQAVEQETASAPGRTLQREQLGRAVIALVYSATLLSEAQFDRVIQAVVPAEEAPLTKGAAALLKLGALESKGDAAEVDALLEMFDGDMSDAQITGAYLGLGEINVTRGIFAILLNDNARLESTARRYIALDKRAKRPGLANATESAIEFVRAVLRRDYDLARKLLDIPRKTRVKVAEGLQIYRDRLEEATAGKATSGLAEFADIVGLLSIEGSFDRWYELARLVGSKRPARSSVENALAYQYEDYLGTVRYLIGNPFLLPVVLEAPPIINEHFGPEAPIALELVTDPEDGGDQELFILIGTALPPEDALGHLGQLDRQWWLNKSAETHCLLNIDVRYLDPATL